MGTNLNFFFVFSNFSRMTDFLKSFWKLIISEISRLSDFNNDKIVIDLFSSTFVKIVSTVSPEDKMQLVSLLEEQNLEANPLLSAGVSVLISWLKQMDMCIVSREYVSVLLSDRSLIIDRLLNPISVRIFESFFPKESLNELANRLDLDLVPQLVSKEDKIRVMGCKFLSENLFLMMQNSIFEISDWIKTSRDSDIIELTLTSLVNTPRLITLFRFVTAMNLKENFLTVVAISLRKNFALKNSRLTEIEDMFFSVPNVGNVMDRWLDKELGKYNKLVFEVAKKYLSSGGQAHLELFRAAVRPAFPDNDSEWITLPFGGNIDSLIAEFLQTKDSSFHALACAMTAATIGQILRFFPSHFVVDDEKVRLTNAGMKVSFLLASNRLETPSIVPNSTTSIPVLGLESEVAEETSDQQHQTSAMPESLVDVLLKEQLAKLPGHVFLNRPYPTRIQPGVYRFGSREVTFHTKGGSLFVYRVGTHVSESDAVAFLAREFDVAIKDSVPVRAPQRPPPREESTATNFKTRLCAMYQQGRCNRGSSCGFAHGQSELRGGSGSSEQTGQYYKTRMCNAFLEGRCSRGAGCSYAHTEVERAEYATGVVPRRDIRGTQDLRMAEKLKAVKQRYDSSDDDAPPKRARTKSPKREPEVIRIAAKPLPYIPPPRAATKQGIDEAEL